MLSNSCGTGSFIRGLEDLETEVPQWGPGANLNLGQLRLERYAPTIHFLASIWSLGNEDLQMLNQFADIVSDFECRNDKNSKISHNSPPDSWQVSILVGAKRRPCGAKPPAYACHRYCRRTIIQTTLCLKKVPTFKLSVTLSNLNRFSKFLDCWKAYEICYKRRRRSRRRQGRIKH